MSLERKDVRFKLSPEVHGALAVLAECAQMDIGEFVEGLVQREVLQRVHDATVIADAAARLGISGNRRASPGTSGSAGS
jgi:hypothetical protein